MIPPQYAFKLWIMVRVIAKRPEPLNKWIERVVCRLITKSNLIGSWAGTLAAPRPGMQSGRGG